jgi:hypothetical protein
MIIWMEPPITSQRKDAPLLAYKAVRFSLSSTPQFSICLEKIKGGRRKAGLRRGEWRVEKNLVHLIVNHDTRNQCDRGANPSGRDPTTRNDSPNGHAFRHGGKGTCSNHTY